MTEHRNRAATANEIAIAMHQFLAGSDEVRFIAAVRTYVRLARDRGLSIEQVLAVLNAIMAPLPPMPHAPAHEPGRLRQLVLRGLLLAYYGDAIVAAQDAARAQRRTGDQAVVVRPPAPGGVTNAS